METDFFKLYNQKQCDKLLNFKSEANELIPPILDKKSN